MGSLLFLYFLHPITTRLANKTQRIYSRYELTNPTKTPPPPFAFSLLSVILLHLHYTLQPLSTLFPIPFSLCYYLPFLCYSVSSSSVTTLCSFVTLSPHPLLLFSVPLLLCLLIPCLLISCRVKNVYLSYPQGPLLCLRQGLSSMQNMPFLPLEDALLACRTCPSWRHVFKSLIVRSLR